MPSPTYYSLTVPPSGVIRFPDIQPTDTTNPSPAFDTSFRRMAITANSNNSAAINIDNGPPRLQPGAQITVTIEQPGLLFLRGTPGDGIGFTY